MSEEYSKEDLVRLLIDPELLRLYGHQITPKGCIALILMTELDMDDEDAETVASKIENLIFLQGYIYVHQNQVEMRDPDVG